MKSLFPWRLFWKFFWAIIILTNLLFVISLALASYIIDFQFYKTEPLYIIGFHLILSVLASIVFAYKFTNPLRNVIASALRLANKKQFNEKDEEYEDILEEEPGEYFELELALSKIKKKMKKRRLQLAHEREETRALISSLDDAIVSVDLGQKVKFFNSKFANQFLTLDQAKYLSEGDAIPLTEVFRRPEIRELFQKTLEKGLSQSGHLQIYSIIDSGERDFILRVSPLKEEKSDVLYGALALFHDITDLKKADKIRIEFVENASHELRTPLTSIRGFLSTAREDLAAGRLEQLPYFLGIISKSVDRLVELVGDMLTISSLEANGGLQKEQIQVDLLTQDITERMANLAAEKGILIHYFCDAKAVYGDSRKIEQVISNLVGNAIKYINPGGRIDIRWEQENSGVALKVIDNGPGIADVHLSRLFERFYRIDKGRSRDAGGTGLGLSIVKHIMQSHGGSISVQSELGKGTEFICRFPLVSK